MIARTLGIGVAAAVLAADQATKTAVLSRLPEGPATALGPFVNLTLRWNQGVSFSLFTQNSAAGKAAILALTLAATALLAWWLSRAHSHVVSAGLGAIIGGALGNAADRATHGAVVDFLDLHAFGRHFFVFNLADAAINVGVALLLIDLVFGVRSPEGQFRKVVGDESVESGSTALVVATESPESAAISKRDSSARGGDGGAARKDGS